MKIAWPALSFAFSARAFSDPIESDRALALFLKRFLAKNRRPLRWKTLQRLPSRSLTRVKATACSNEMGLGLLHLGISPRLMRWTSTTMNLASIIAFYEILHPYWHD
jgi:hypothetical protein